MRLHLRSSKPREVREERNQYGWTVGVESPFEYSYVKSQGTRTVEPCFFGDHGFILVNQAVIENILLVLTNVVN